MPNPSSSSSSSSLDSVLSSASDDTQELLAQQPPTGNGSTNGDGGDGVEALRVDRPLKRSRPSVESMPSSSSSSSESDIAAETEKCQLCKKPSELFATFATICKCCMGALLGATKFPACRFCSDTSMECNCRSSDNATCSQCECEMSKDDYLLEHTKFYRGMKRSDVCFLCRPMDLEKHWRNRDSPIVLELARKHGIQMYDCDPVMSSRSSFFDTILPAQEIAGEYDIIYTKWSTSGTKCVCSDEVGDLLLKRTTRGSLKLVASPNTGMHDTDSDDVEDSTTTALALTGVVELEGGGVYFNNTLIDPFNKTIEFRFVQGFSEEAMCRVGVGEELSYWNGDYSCTIDLDVVRHNDSIKWIPRDDCNGDSEYSKQLRGEVQHFVSRGGSQSWLHRHKNLPKRICKQIHGYLGYPLPTCIQPALEIQKHDLWLSIELDEYSTSLEAHFLARRKGVC